MARRTPQQTRSIDIQALKAAGYFSALKRLTGVMYRIVVQISRGSGQTSMQLSGNSLSPSPPS